MFRIACCLALITTSAFADCKPVWEAAAKTHRTPHKTAVSNIDMTIIYTHDAIYTWAEGKWEQERLPLMTPADFARQNPNQTCVLEGTDVIDGQEAERYGISTPTSKSTIWIFKKTGLYAKQSTQAAIWTTTYQNIKAPM